jgi:hypothetical protein
MPTAPDKISENVDFAAQELLVAPADQRLAMLKNIAKALMSRARHTSQFAEGQTPAVKAE